MRTNKLPKTIAKWILDNTDKVQDYTIEEDYGDYSIWIYLYDGWINAALDIPCIHAYSVADFREQAKHVVRE